MIRTNGDANKLNPADRPAHNWYRFVLSYPPHLVREYLDRFKIRPGQVVLDPFCGTGTTLVEAKKRGITSVGLEANPLAHFASTVKTDWSPDPKALETTASTVAEAARRRLKADGIPELDLPLFATGSSSTARERLLSLPPESAKLLLADSLSPLPLHRCLRLLEAIDLGGVLRIRDHMRLALARELVNGISNLRFGPEVGLGQIRQDAPVVSPWFRTVREMSEDIRILHSDQVVPTQVHLADSRDMCRIIAPNSIDAVITSPPYPNEKDYTRTTRLESVLLGFIRNKEDLRNLKKHLIRSNTRNVYVGDTDDLWVDSNSRIHKIAADIEDRRIALGKTSGFERLYGRVAMLYFGGMARHLASLRSLLRPGARLAYVVGDQASYLRIMIRTGQILGEVAESLGYHVSGIDLFRTRMATATREELREEVLLLEWRG